MLFGEWLVYAVISIFCWGMINVLDSYFVGCEDVYRDEYEGMIISSLYKIIGVAIVGGFFFTKVIDISLVNALLSMLGGILISTAFMFYFFAVFYHNDLSLVQVFWNFSTPLVVVLAWVFLGEELNTNAYIGIGIVFLGSIVISFSKNQFKDKLGKLFMILIPMIVFYSVSEVLMKYLEEGRHVEFGQSFPFLCLGQVLFGIILLIVRWRKIQGTGFIKRMAGQNWFLFLSSEGLEITALFFMQLAIVKTPSVSLFGAMEAFMPLMAILLAGASVFILKFFKRENVLKKVYSENMVSGLTAKIIATAMMMVGIYLIG